VVEDNSNNTEEEDEEEEEDVVVDISTITTIVKVEKMVVVVAAAAAVVVDGTIITTTTPTTEEEQEVVVDELEDEDEAVVDEEILAMKFLPKKEFLRTVLLTLPLKVVRMVIWMQFMIAFARTSNNRNNSNPKRRSICSCVVEISSLFEVRLIFTTLPHRPSIDNWEVLLPIIMANVGHLY